MSVQDLALGFGWGVVATIVMSVLMLIGMLTGISPLPKPIPMAIVGTIFGQGAPKPLLMLLAIVSHLMSWRSLGGAAGY